MHRAQHCRMALTESPCVGVVLKPTHASDVKTFTCVSKQDCGCDAGPSCVESRIVGVMRAQAVWNPHSLGPNHIHNSACSPDPPTGAARKYIIWMEGGLAPWPSCQARVGGGWWVVGGGWWVVMQ